VCYAREERRWLHYSRVVSRLLELPDSYIAYKVEMVEQPHVGRSIAGQGGKNEILGPNGWAEVSCI
jgi:hypothetical protein